MAWHNAPCINFHALFFGTIVQVLHYALKINPPYKYIHQNTVAKLIKYKPSGLWNL